MNKEISDYIFKDFSTGESNTTEYKFIDFKENEIENVVEKKERIQNEIKVSRETGFKILPTVRKYRGIQKNEQQEFDEKVKEEIQRAYDRYYNEWKEKGYNDGKKEGMFEIESTYEKYLEDKINDFSVVIDEAIGMREKILKDQGSYIIKMISSLCKWIFLKEVKSDEDYILRLLERLLLETKNKKFITIKVNESSLSHLENNIDKIKDRFKEVEEVVLQVGNFEDQPGLIVDSEGGIIDGTFATQMKNFDLIFKDIEIEDN